MGKFPRLNRRAVRRILWLRPPNLYIRASTTLGASVGARIEFPVDGAVGPSNPGAIYGIDARKGTKRSSYFLVRDGRLRVAAGSLSAPIISAQRVTNSA